MSKHKLLLADDSITIQKVVNLTFADEGVEVISVGDGNAAIEKLAEFTPDLVMADINMPGLSGYEICERIRAVEATRDIPVILLFGSFEPFDEAEARRVGANDFLTKPFQSIRQLVAKVSGLLESAGKTSTDHIISDLETPKSPSEFENTLEMEQPKTAAADEFGDSGMDDDLIQTAQIGGAETVQEADDPRITQPLTTAEFDEIHQNSETAERGYAFVGESPFAEPTAEEQQSSNLAETEPLPKNDYFYQTQEVMPKPTFEAEDESNLLELPPQESLSAAALSQPVWQEVISPPVEEAQTPAEEVFETVPGGETAETVESDFQMRETMTEEPQADEEIQTEARTISDETAVEEVSQESETVADTVSDGQEMAEESADETQTAVSEVTGEATQEIDLREAPTDEMIDINEVGTAETPGEAAQIPELSPAVIEAIAAKVSEKFSDNVIREIVEEIKPQITELIAKRIAE